MWPSVGSRAQALGLLLSALVWPIPPAPAAAAAGPELELARRLAAPWPALQRPNGRFVDALQPGGRPRRHACAVLAYGLLLTGANHHDRRLIQSAVRAISAG